MITDVEIKGGQGHRLAGKLHLPDVDPGLDADRPRTKGSVLMAHCFTCSKDLHTMTRLATGLSEAGYATLRFDFTGLGESGGDFAETSVSANISDLTRAAATLIEMGYGPCGLIGHSLGGAAAILAARRLKTVRSLVTIGAPSSTSHVTHLFADDVEALKSQGRATVSISGRSFDLDAEFLDDLERHSVIDEVAQLARPYCTVHAQDDAVVAFESAERLHQAAAEPKQLVSFATGGHLFTNRSTANDMVTAIINWFDATL